MISCARFFWTKHLTVAPNRFQLSSMSASAQSLLGDDSGIVYELKLESFHGCAWRIGFEKCISTCCFTCCLTSCFTCCWQVLGFSFINWLFISPGSGPMTSWPARWKSGFCWMRRSCGPNLLQRWKPTWPWTTVFCCDHLLLMPLCRSGFCLKGGAVFNQCWFGLVLVGLVSHSHITLARWPSHKCPSLAGKSRSQLWLAHALGSLLRQVLWSRTFHCQIQRRRLALSCACVPLPWVVEVPLLLACMSADPCTVRAALGRFLAVQKLSRILMEWPMSPKIKSASCPLEMRLQLWFLELKDLNLLNIPQLTPLEVLGLQVLGPQVLGLAVLGPKVLELHTARWRLMMLASMTVFLRSVLEVHLVWSPAAIWQAHHQCHKHMQVGPPWMHQRCVPGSWLTSGSLSGHPSLSRNTWTLGRSRMVCHWMVRPVCQPLHLGLTTAPTSTTINRRSTTPQFGPSHSVLISTFALPLQTFCSFFFAPHIFKALHHMFFCAGFMWEWMWCLCFIISSGISSFWPQPSKRGWIMCWAKPPNSMSSSAWGFASADSGSITYWKVKWSGDRP